MSQSILILVGPDYEDLELWYPKLRLEEAGFSVKIAGLGEKNYRGKHGYPCTVDGAVEDFKANDFAGIVVPGGWAPDRIRRSPAALSLVKQLSSDNKLVASICHGPWVLISAQVVKGKKMTSVAAIKDDLINAGANWVDESVVVDGALVTSRVPSDLPAFAKAMLGVLQKSR